MSVVIFVLDYLSLHQYALLLPAGMVNVPGTHQNDAGDIFYTI